MPSATSATGFRRLPVSSFGLSSTGAAPGGSYSGDDPLLLDTGPHAFDLVRWLTDADVVRVRALESQHGALVELELDEGRGTAHWSCGQTGRTARLPRSGVTETS